MKNVAEVYWADRIWLKCACQTQNVPGNDLPFRSHIPTYYHALYIPKIGILAPNFDFQGHITGKNIDFREKCQL